MSKLRIGKNNKTPEQKRVDEMKDFIEHLMAYVIVNAGLMVLNVATSPNDIWFLWVAFFWGIGLAFHAVDVFMGDGSRLASKVVEKIDKHRDSGRDADSSPTERPAPVSVERAPSLSEISTIIRHGTDVVDNVRRSARQLPQGQPRRDVLSMANRSEEILLAIEEQPEEVLLARDFLNGLLTPMGKLIGDYSRLAGANLESTQPTLRQVEASDFPALIKRLNAVYERLHRGSLIDLEVAREMMALDSPIQPGPNLEPTR